MSKEIFKVKTFWNEQWKKVQTKTPTNLVDYHISNHGRLKSVMKKSGTERLLNPTKMRDGYMRANIKVQGGKMEVYTIHRLVFQYFAKTKNEEKYFIIHKDGNKGNNHLKNLELLNREQLSKRWDKEGFYKNLPPKKNVKLTESKVRLLRQRIKKGKTKRQILARQFNISLTQLKRIESGKNWGYVK